jgi:pyruvate dehydrogenase E1 component beta subunit
VASVDPGKARVLREGDDVLLIAWGPSIPLALEAADALTDDGASVEVLDLVSLAPLDEDAILDSARKCGRVVVVSEEVQRCSLASEVAATVASGAFCDLQAPVRIVAAPNRPIPAASREHSYFPSLEDILVAVKEARR